MPPEAHQSSPLTTAADVYQFGGLCYFMAMGTHPPAGLHQASLPDCVAEEWRQLVSLCRAGNPADRPTVAQLQLLPAQHLPAACQAGPQGSEVHRQGKPSCVYSALLLRPQARAALPRYEPQRSASLGGHHFRLCCSAASHGL